MIALLTVSNFAFSENVPANKCEIYVSRLAASPSSHSSASMNVVVKVGWIGNDEFIQLVGFYGYTAVHDLGNSRDCHWQTYSSEWKVTPAYTTSSYPLEYGEYNLNFPVRTGSVTSQCPGYDFTWVGSIFVQTNKNTYWLNPGLNRDNQFYFDNNAYYLVQQKGGTSLMVRTQREDMRYYNPLMCK